MTAIAHTLAAHLETTQPHIPPRQPTRTEQFIDAPPLDKYHSRWRRDCADNPDALYVMNPTAVHVTNQLRGNFNCDDRTKSEAD